MVCFVGNINGSQTQLENFVQKFQVHYNVSLSFDSSAL